jgi:hypothetical protein
VLQAIRMIAGMKGVAVIHERRLMGQGAARRNGAVRGQTDQCPACAPSGGERGLGRASPVLE